MKVDRYIEPAKPRGVQFIVTAAVYWGFNSMRRLAANISF